MIVLIWEVGGEDDYLVYIEKEIEGLTKKLITIIMKLNLYNLNSFS